jgi:hypothetical protein
LRLRFRLRFRNRRKRRRSARHNPAYVRTYTETYFERHKAFSDEPSDELSSELSGEPCGTLSAPEEPVCSLQRRMADCGLRGGTGYSARSIFAVALMPGAVRRQTWTPGEQFKPYVTGAMRRKQ